MTSLNIRGMASTLVDAARVAHWKRVLDAAPGGPKVGLLWKSMKLSGARARYFSPFDQWQAVLKTPGISFVGPTSFDIPDLDPFMRSMIETEVALDKQVADPGMFILRIDPSAGATCDASSTRTSACLRRRSRTRSGSTSRGSSSSRPIYR